MQRLFYLLASIFLLVGVYSCSTPGKLLTDRPKADTLALKSFETQTSYINLGVSMALKDIELQINKILTGTIYEDNNIEDDKLMIRVEKQSPILIQDAGGKLKTVLPLKIWVKIKYGTSLLGMNLYDTRELNLNGVISFLSDVSMSNWKMNTHSKIISLDWKESPSIQIAGKQVPITYILNPAISLFKSSIEKRVDEALRKSLDFKPEVLNALENIARPVEVNHAFDTWFRMAPEELYATDARLKNSQVSMELGLKCQMETYIGQHPENTFDRNKIALKAVSTMPNQITAHLAVMSGYEEASRILTKNFKGQEFVQGGKKVSVENLELWQNKGMLIIALSLKGSLNGIVYLSGIPKYDSIRKEIYFDEMDYLLDTQNKLLKVGSWMAQGLILMKIQQFCRYSIKSNLEESKQSMLKYLSNYSPMPGIYLNGQVGDVEFEKIELSGRALVAILSLSGVLKVDIRGLQ